MTDLNNFNHVDNYDDVLAAHVNELIAASLVSKFKNVETLAATRTLLDIDTPIQRFDCNGANRDVKCPTPNAVSNHAFWLVNSSAGAFSLVVKNNSGATTHVTVTQGNAAMMIPDGNGGYLPLYVGATSGGADENIVTSFVMAFS